MPRALSTQGTFRIVLEGDKGNPDEPAFFARNISVGAFTSIMEVLTHIKEEDSAAAQFTAAFAVVSKCIVDWENMFDPDTGEDIPFSQENLANVLDIMECIELLEALLQSAQLSVPEQKK